MLAGQTQTASFLDTHSASVDYDALPTVSVLQPDGAELSPALTVSSSPAYNVAATSHTLSATDDFTQAGEYSYRWSRVIDGVTSVYAQVVFAAWTDVYAAIRRLLNRNATQLPDATIDIELARLTRLLLADYPCLGAYDDLTGLDRTYFDDALVYMATTQIRRYIGRTSSDGDLVKRREGDTEYTFANRSSETGGLEGDWLTVGWDAFRRLSCIAEIVSATRSGLRLFSLSGRRRAAEKAGYIVPTENPLLRYLIDEERRMQGIGVNV